MHSNKERDNQRNNTEKNDNHGTNKLNAPE